MSKTNSNYFIVRAKNAGLFFGQISERNGNDVTMTNVRKVFYWDGAAAPEQLAVDGSKKPENCKLTVRVESMEIAEWIQIIPCTEKATKNLDAIPEWKQ